MSVANEWIVLPVSDGWIASAQAMRAERDKLYRNVFVERSTDARWVGELGEIVFDCWLSERDVEHDWLTEHPAGKADFKIRSVDVGVKAVKRKVAVRENYTAQITAGHAEEPVDHLFFMSYEYPRKVMWLLGGIPKEQFLKVARFYSGGESVHGRYRVRKGHSIYNAEIRELAGPDNWLSLLTAA